MNAIHRRDFVVTTKEKEVLRVFDLVGKEQANSLKGLLAIVHVIAKKEVVGLWWESSILEPTEQIIVLAVNISANLVGAKSQHTLVCYVGCSRMSVLTLIGASSSSRIGCDIKISRAFSHKKRISDSSS